ncbi:serine hydrolase domain-containing protein [Myroides fluvii]|uniref:serine hydrolase domain-containing protein n=1 Tax=Myroides fluvii TaxID=2572594 RepID=UPI00131C8945|nr:serine hydrolase domain-containing protein [Myroides fluvii]
MKKNGYFSLLLLFVASIAWAQKFDTAKADEYIQRITLHQRGIGSVAIYKNNKTVYARDFGHELVGEKNQNPHLYRIGSITKMFTAVLIYQLVEEGKLKLDDRIASYFPELAISNLFTLKISDLLSHTSGLDDYTCKEDDFYWLKEHQSQEDLLDNITQQGTPHYGAKKKNFFFSNTGYYLLARIVEQKRNLSYDEAVKKHIIQKIKLQHTYTASDVLPYAVQSYQLFDQWEVMDEMQIENTNGVNDLISSLDDLARFNQALFAHKLILKTSLASMKPVPYKEKYGRGMMYYLYKKKNFVGHTGGTFGTFSLLYYNEAEKLTLVYAINGAAFSHYQLFDALLAILYNKKYVLPSYETIPVTAEQLQPFVGTYRQGQLDLTIEFVIEKNKLFLKPSGCNRYALLDAIGENTFRSPEGTVTYSFNPANKQVVVQQLKANFVLNKIERE